MAIPYKMGLVEVEEDQSPDYLQLSGQEGDLLLIETYSPPPPVTKDEWLSPGVQSVTRRGGL